MTRRMQTHAANKPVNRLNRRSLNHTCFVQSSTHMHIMGRKRRKYDTSHRHLSSKTAQSADETATTTPDIIVDGKFDASNPLIHTKSKTKVKKKGPAPRKKVLSKKQQKKLEQILRRKQKKEDRSSILDQLSKHRVSKSELDAMRTASLTRKRTASQSADHDMDEEMTEKRVRLPNPDDVEPENTIEEEDDPSVVRFKAGDSSDADSSGDENESEDRENGTTESCDRTTSERDPKKENKLIMTVDEDAVDVRCSESRERAADEKTVFVRVVRDPQVEEMRLKLPILAEEQTIMEAIRYNNVVIVCGETGSGKTTQIPQFLFEAGYAVSKKIAVTEPRRVAAISMSKRVATEMSFSSDIVSYHVRYDKNTSDRTKIAFMTDGILLKEIQEDFLLTCYSVVIIDEAHERSVFSDILIGLLSRIVRLRDKKQDPLRLIIMSATLRVDTFADNKRLFTQRPPVIRIGSRQHPVTIHFSKQTPENHVQAAFSRVCRIHRTQPAGGILVFVTGRNDVLTLCRKLRRTFSGRKDESLSSKSSMTKQQKKSRKNRAIGNLLPRVNLDDFTEPETLFADEHESDVSESEEKAEESSDDESYSSSDPMFCLPLYSMLPKDKQELVFKPPPADHRLCVIATNIAETSLTIPGIKYVVDTGKVKTKVYDKTTGISAFVVEWCSRASADQRAGRAGRTSAGHCYRLYSSAVFSNQFKLFSDPEIIQKPVDDLVLQMKSLGIVNIRNFPFPSPPPDEALLSSERRLCQMGALQEIKTSVSVHGHKATTLTKLGQAMSNFPVSPRYGRMFAFAYNEIMPYVTALVAGLTVQEIFIFAGDKNSEESDVNDAERRSKWLCLRRRWSGVGEEHLLGDLMVMLKAIGASEFTAGSASFSLNNGISHKAMCEVHRLRRQLTSQVNRLFSLKSLECMSLTLEPPTQTIALHLRQLSLVAFYDQVARYVASPSVMK